MDKNLNIMDDIHQKAVKLHDGNQDMAMRWLREKNPHFGNNPLFGICKSYEGAQKVEAYIDQELNIKKRLGAAKYRQRNLTQMANRLFRDPRKAYDWLQEPEPFIDDKKSALEAAGDSADHMELLISEMHMATLRDEYRPKNETYEERLDRFNRVARYVFDSDSAGRRWIKSRRIPVLDGQSPEELLKTDQGMERVENSLVAIQYGHFS